MSPRRGATLLSLVLAAAGLGGCAGQHAPAPPHAARKPTSPRPATGEAARLARLRIVFPDGRSLPVDDRMDPVRFELTWSRRGERGGSAERPSEFAVVMPEFGPPRLGTGERVDWTPAPEYRPLRTLPPVYFVAARESIPAWRATTEPPDFRAFALCRLGRMYLARADTSRADSCFAVLSTLPSVWQWEALRSRTDLLTARGQDARADSMLEVADRSGWQDLERAAWLVRRSRLRAAMGDSARAIEFCRQVILRYPSLPPAASGLSMLEALLKARGAGLSSEDQSAAAEVESFKPDLVAATARLERAFGRAPAGDRSRIGLRLARGQRLLRRFPAALSTLARVRWAAPDPSDRSRADLERARVQRDSGQFDSAYAWFEIAAQEAPDSSIRESAWWEGAQAAEDAGAWSRARHTYRRLWESGGRRGDEAGLRLGFLWLAEGAADSALASWEPLSGEAARFWRAIARRKLGRADPDSALQALAALPGYDFYRAAARETLGVRGWTGAVAEGTQVPSSSGLELASSLMAIGERNDALFVLSRWAAGDPRLDGHSTVAARRDSRELLVASRIAEGLGQVPAGIHYATLAFGAAQDSTELAWRVAPWVYPPAFDSLLARWPERSAGDSWDRFLIQAVAWQESKFDPKARSRSNALGLLQIKRATAAEIARALDDPEPSEQVLLDPATNLRYGTHYLRRLLERFDGDIALTLSAYNAGPSNISPRWRRIVAEGGDALLAELASRPETRDYVKRILGVRQAYREIRPVGRRR